MTSKDSDQIRSIAQSVAHRLLAIQAVELRPDAPFTWASGWLSPIYCDNRKTLSYPAHRSYIKQAFALQVSDLYPDAEDKCPNTAAGVKVDAKGCPIAPADNAKSKTGGKQTAKPMPITGGVAGSLAALSLLVTVAGVALVARRYAK